MFHDKHVVRLHQPRRDGQRHALAVVGEEAEDVHAADGDLEVDVQVGRDMKVGFGVSFPSLLA